MRLRPGSRHLTLVLCAVVNLAGWPLLLLGAGGIATDGTLGHPAQTLTGPNFTIGPNLGQTRGGNLFHSFSVFDLESGQTATFTGPSSIHDVFARVTGPDPSTIDGTLSCSIPNATFFLIDPNGVMFGPDAKLDVKGSFAVTTADKVKFGTGGSYNAAHPARSVLTTAAPSAFGFLSPQPAGVSLQRAALVVPQGQALSVVSGPIQLVHSDLNAPGGQANLIAVASPGQAKLDVDDANPASGASSFSSFANISLTQGSQVNLNGPAGGGFLLRGNDLTLDHSIIASTTGGRMAGADGDIIASRTLSLTDDSRITSNLTGAGRGGKLTVAARHLVLEGGDSGQLTLLAARAESHATGQAGGIAIHAGTVQVLAGAEISGNTYGAGRGGNLSITASSLILDDHGDLDPGSDIACGIFTGSGSSARSAGAAGDLLVDAGTVQVLAGARIAADTAGPGQGGNLSITASSLILDGRGDPKPTIDITGAFAEALRGASGSAGGLKIQAGKIQVLAGAEINADTYGSGRGGNMSITASRLLLSDHGNPDPIANVTGLFATTFSSRRRAGAAGNLRVDAGIVRVLAGARIAANTAGSGSGGDLNLNTSRLLVDDHGDPLPKLHEAGIYAEATTGASGSAGNLLIQAGTVRVLAGGEINADTFGPGRGGNLNFTASTLDLDDRGNPNPSVNITGIFTESARGASGAAGSLTVQAGTVRVLAGAEINADTFSSGQGGNLSIAASSLLLSDRGDPNPTFNTTGLFATSLRSRGRAGDAGSLTVDADDVRVLAGAKIAANTFGSGSGGNLSLTTSSLLVDDRGDPIPKLHEAGVFAEAELGSSGSAGNLTLQAGTVKVLAGGEINADTFGLGRGGNLDFTASTLILDDRGDPDPRSETTGLLATTNSLARNAGAAGDLTLDADTVRVLAGARISVSTFGSGRGGNLSLTASTLDLDAADTLDPRLHETGIFDISASVARRAGAAGDLGVQAEAVRIMAGAKISATSSGPGTGGGILVNAQNLLVSGFNQTAGDSAIAADSLGSGAAGSVQVSGSHRVTLSRGGTVAALATLSNAGDVQVTSEDGSILLRGGRISAHAKLEAGSVAVSAPLFVTMQHHSKIITESGSANGGDISIDPLELTLAGDSRISANAPKGQGGNITIDADELVGVRADVRLGHRNVTATGQTSSGQIANGPANNDVAQSLAQLPSQLESTELTLRPQCGQMVDLSTFLIQGRGGVPAGPGQWQLDFDVTPWPGDSQP